MANSLKSRSVDHPYRIIFIVCAVITVGAGVLRRPDVDEDLKEHLPEQATGRGFTTSVTCQAMPSGSIRRLAPFLPSHHDPSGYAVHGAGNVR